MTSDQDEKLRRDLGDFQTPPELVAEVLATLGPIGARWPRVLEPTCGRGHFLGGLLAHASPPREVQAIEIQPAHCRAAGELAARYRDRDTEVTITCADLFGLDLARDLAWRQGGPLLVVGNPPWVTNAELGSLASTQVPAEVEREGAQRVGGPDRRCQFRRGRGGLAQAGPRSRGRGADDRALVQDLRGAQHPPVRPSCDDCRSSPRRSAGSMRLGGSTRRWTLACSR